MIKVYIKILDTDRVYDMIGWCDRNIDPAKILWDWSYVDDSDLNSDVNFYFECEQDATMFALKWL